MPQLFDPAPSLYHDPVEASSIVVAADSVGATLCLSLIQVILDLKKKTPMCPSVRLHNRNVDIKMPAGLPCLLWMGT